MKLLIHSKFTGCIFEVWEWTINFIPKFLDVIIYSYNFNKSDPWDVRVYDSTTISRLNTQRILSSSIDATHFCTCVLKTQIHDKIEVCKQIL